MSADLRARVDQAALVLDAYGSRREVQLIAISGGDDPGKFFSTIFVRVTVRSRV
jgi:hypothetical protein